MTLFTVAIAAAVIAFCYCVPVIDEPFTRVFSDSPGEECSLLRDGSLRAHPANEHRFYRCEAIAEGDWPAGVWVQYECQSGQSFNSESHRCVEPGLSLPKPVAKSSNTSTRRQPSSGCVASDFVETGGRCCVGAPLQADKNNRNQYLQCSGNGANAIEGKWVQMPCPKGLEFNADIEQCLAPGSVVSESASSMRQQYVLANSNQGMVNTGLNTGLNQPMVTGQQVNVIDLGTANYPYQIPMGGNTMGYGTAGVMTGSSIQGYGTAGVMTGSSYLPSAGSYLPSTGSYLPSTGYAAPSNVVPIIMNQPTMPSTPVFIPTTSNTVPGIVAPAAAAVGPSLPVCPNGQQTRVTCNSGLCPASTSCYQGGCCQIQSQCPGVQLSLSSSSPCLSTASCPGGYYCSVSLQVCCPGAGRKCPDGSTATATSCSTDTQCPSNYYCETSVGACCLRAQTPTAVTPTNRNSEMSTLCRTGQMAIGLCSMNTDCPFGYYCMSSLCCPVQSYFENTAANNSETLAETPPPSVPSTPSVPPVVLSSWKFPIKLLKEDITMSLDDVPESTENLLLKNIPRSQSTALQNLFLKPFFKSHQKSNTPSVNQYDLSSFLRPLLNRASTATVAPPTATTSPRMFLVPAAPVYGHYPAETHKHVDHRQTSEPEADQSVTQTTPPTTVEPQTARYPLEDGDLIIELKKKKESGNEPTNAGIPLWHNGFYGNSHGLHGSYNQSYPATNYGNRFPPRPRTNPNLSNTPTAATPNIPQNKFTTEQPEVMTLSSKELPTNPYSVDIRPQLGQDDIRYRLTAHTKQLVRKLAERQKQLMWIMTALKQQKKQADRQTSRQAYGTNFFVDPQNNVNNVDNSLYSGYNIPQRIQNYPSSFQPNQLNPTWFPNSLQSPTAPSLFPTSHSNIPGLSDALPRFSNNPYYRSVPGTDYRTAPRQFIDGYTETKAKNVSRQPISFPGLNFPPFTNLLPFPQSLPTAPALPSPFLPLPPVPPANLVPPPPIYGSIGYMNAPPALLPLPGLPCPPTVCIVEPTTTAAPTCADGSSPLASIATCTVGLNQCPAGYTCQNQRCCLNTVNPSNSCPDGSFPLSNPSYCALNVVTCPSEYYCAAHINRCCTLGSYRRCEDGSDPLPNIRCFGGSSPYDQCPVGYGCTSQHACCKIINWQRMCPDGIVGLPIPTLCSDDVTSNNRCPDGYYCTGVSPSFSRVCCLAQNTARGCPDGSPSLSKPPVCGPSINLCPAGFYCTEKSVCCRNSQVSRVCPDGSNARVRPFQCSYDSDCGSGYYCSGMSVCCPTRTDRQGTCPGNFPPLSSPKPCSATGTTSRCPPGYYCSPNDVCCAISSRTCPDGSLALTTPPTCVPGSVGQCSSGSYCTSTGVCCEGTLQGQCPDQSQPVSACVNQQCQSGYSCVQPSNICCKGTTSTCPDSSEAVGACINGLCGSGYTCVAPANICCQTTTTANVCPDGSTAVGSCLTGGTCGAGFACVTSSNLCCRTTATTRTCSDGVEAVALCMSGACGLGYRCDSTVNYCCAATAIGTCPAGSTAIGPCVNGLCASGYTCINSVCCTSTTTPTSKCPAGSQAFCSCRNGLCPNGYSCVNNVCCSNNGACPSGEEALGECQNSICPLGYQCTGGFCCSEEVTSCPGGQSSLGRCSVTGGLCPLGYACTGGQCCPEDACPDGSNGAGTCQGGLCPIGYECTNGACCVEGTNACPAGSSSLGSCIGTLCPAGYTCISGTCCSSSSTTSCPNNAASLGACINGLCAQGYTCISNQCCTDASTAVCANGAAPLGECINNLCPGGYECLNGACCAVATTSTGCPGNAVSVGNCLNGLCPSGYTCYNTLCCAIATTTLTCPNNAASLGACVNGLCAPGYSCLNNQCCQTSTSGGLTPNTGPCPGGVASVGTCANGQGCPAGAECKFGNCCGIGSAVTSGCPNNAASSGVCNSGQCALGYSCYSIANLCCWIGGSTGSTSTGASTCPYGGNELLNPEFCATSNNCPLGYFCYSNQKCCPMEGIISQGQDLCPDGSSASTPCSMNSCPGTMSCVAAQNTGRMVCCQTTTSVTTTPTIISYPSYPIVMPFCPGCPSSQVVPATTYSLVTLPTVCNDGSTPLGTCATTLNTCPMGYMCVNRICCRTSSESVTSGGACQSANQCIGFRLGFSTCAASRCQCVQPAVQFGGLCTTAAAAKKMKRKMSKLRLQDAVTVDPATVPCQSIRDCQPGQTCHKAQCVTVFYPGERGCRSDLECSAACAVATCSMGGDSSQCICANGLVRFGRKCLRKCPPGTTPSASGGECLHTPFSLQMHDSVGFETDVAIESVC